MSTLCLPHDRQAPKSRTARRAWLHDQRYKHSGHGGPAPAESIRPSAGGRFRGTRAKKPGDLNASRTRTSERRRTVPDHAGRGERRGCHSGTDHVREVVARDHEEHGDIRRRLEDPVHLSGAATAVATAQSQVACCTPKHGRLHAEIWPVARRIAASPHCRTRRRASLPLGLTHRVKRDRSPRRQGRRRVVPAQWALWLPPLR